MESVTKNYLNQKALRGVDFKIPPGKIIGIIGENGSGKSTSLKMMAGLIKPSSGKISIDDQPSSRLNVEKVAYMSELDHFFPYFTVGEAIRFYASQFEDFDIEKANEILQFMKLDSSKRVKHLSKGNRGRLKMACTLSRNAPYILLDEPFSGLDPMVRNSIVKGLIKYIDLEKQSLIITTHEIREVEPILDEVIVIREGRIIGQSSVDEIREEFGKDVVEWMELLYEGGELND